MALAAHLWWSFRVHHTHAGSQSAGTSGCHHRGGGSRGHRWYTGRHHHRQRCTWRHWRCAACRHRHVKHAATHATRLDTPGTGGILAIAGRGGCPAVVPLPPQHITATVTACAGATHEASVARRFHLQPSQAKPHTATTRHVPPGTADAAPPAAKGGGAREGMGGMPPASPFASDDGGGNPQLHPKPGIGGGPAPARAATAPR